MTVIAIDARYVRERPSGIGAMVQALVREIPWRLPHVEFVLLAHPRAPQPLCDAPNVREICVRAEANGPATLLYLPLLVDLRGVDLFHATFNILPAGLRMPTIATIHDLMWVEEPLLCRAASVYGAVETLFYRVGIGRALREAKLLLTGSEATRRAIGRVSPQAAARTRIAPLGVDSFFCPSRGDLERARDRRARRRLLPGVQRYVLAVGQSAPYKNHLAIVRAFARAFADDRAMHLVIVERLGMGSSQCMAIARSLSVEDRVHLLPVVENEELRALYRGATCLCHPSLVEGWGMPLGEALAAGCPVVTSNQSSMPEVARDAAAYVDPRDDGSIAHGLLRISRDQELRRRSVARGLDRAARLTWDRHVTATLLAYEEALHGRPTSAGPSEELAPRFRRA